MDTRRYDFIRSGDGTTFGKADACLQTSQVNTDTLRRRRFDF